ncbi:hypothetical protein EVJ50_13590 [Synechococcus sp. RSCCF101]|uniref:hypothetical protein n=1 Tax=Synechococcus sp. RSCCF101 TaxID=2511069 RepID=UPI001248B560|nr:hypothetical protein [Synechococcus sp. RSCCF101]QEY33111.1 hypothetical protein EVJ50_13590 [Synechococcus sp. RSCCF101]
MDLSLVGSNGAFRLQPSSVLGMLWLQTHFETDHWDLLAAGRASISADSIDTLCEDAEAGGLRLVKSSADANRVAQDQS